MKIEEYDGFKIYIENVEEEKHFDVIENILKYNNEIFFANFSDHEYITDKGYVVQYAATDTKSFAYPYTSDFGINDFEYKDKFKSDFCFIGGRTSPVRELVLRRIKEYSDKIKISEYIYDGYFNIKHGEYGNSRIKDFKDEISNAKFSLCPRGYGIQSIRFFETLSLNTIPIYIGDCKTKFPLDWLIDWDEISFRFNQDLVNERYFLDFIEKIMNLDISEINKKRERISEIYKEFLYVFDDVPVLLRKLNKRYSNDFIDISRTKYINRIIDYLNNKNKIKLIDGGEKCLKKII